MASWLLLLSRSEKHHSQNSKETNTPFPVHLALEKRRTTFIFGSATSFVALAVPHLDGPAFRDPAYLLPTHLTTCDLSSRENILLEYAKRWFVSRGESRWY
jgi:hypothetical protein